MKLFVILVALFVGAAYGQLSPTASWAAHAQNEYQIFPDLTYVTASGVDVKLDIYQRRG